MGDGETSEFAFQSIDQRHAAASLAQVRGYGQSIPCVDKALRPATFGHVSETSPLKRSPLHDKHVAMGARLVPFAGWEMPVQYTSIVEEHKAVRERVGVFDISHMGQFRFRGEGGAVFLNQALTNNVSKLEVGQGQYSLMLNERGGVIDDLIVYRTDEDDFFLVVNASKIDEDREHLVALGLPGSLQFTDLSDGLGGLAIQGPLSPEVFTAVFGNEVEFPAHNTIQVIESGGEILYFCGTGYTGENGFEFFAPVSSIGEWFKKLVAAAKSVGGMACGLGARDTLRLEMGYPLNGNDLAPDKTPLEAGLGFFVDLGKAQFVGRDVLLAQKESGLPTKLVAFEMTGTAPPPRPHYGILQGDQAVGEICSGALSPSLARGIGMAYLPANLSKLGTPLEIEIRGRRYPAQTVKKPFYRKSN